MADVATIKDKPKNTVPLAPPEGATQQEEIVERACVVCGMGSFRTDWIHKSGSGKDMKVACDFHTDEEFQAGVSGKKHAEKGKPDEPPGKPEDPGNPPQKPPHPEHPGHPEHPTKPEEPPEVEPTQAKHFGTKR